MYIELISTVVSIVLTTVSTILITQMQKQSKKKDASGEALKLLMKREIKELYTECKKQNKITVDQKAWLEEIYTAYHNLGGNSQGTVMYNELCKLEVK